MAMTGKDLDRIQAENSRSASFELMKEAFDARKKKRGVVGRTQYPPFMFPPTKMRMGGSCPSKGGRVISGKSLR
tara:strand:+ start:4976 stop:5197 length:222 start_codon:yes stop_codon:yes gene_type:complete